MQQGIHTLLMEGRHYVVWTPTMSGSSAGAAPEESSIDWIVFYLENEMRSRSPKVSKNFGMQL